MSHALALHTSPTTAGRGGTHRIAVARPQRCATQRMRTVQRPTAPQPGLRAHRRSGPRSSTCSASSPRRSMLHNPPHLRSRDNTMIEACGHDGYTNQTQPDPRRRDTATPPRPRIARSDHLYSSSAWSTFGPHPIGAERFVTVSSGRSFAQVAGAILRKQARGQNPDKWLMAGGHP
jgi:hypothetical protein